MKRTKKYLMFRPQRAPKWWPRQGRFIVWVGVLRGGDGWVRGHGDLMTRAEINMAKAVVQMEWPRVIFKETSRRAK